MSDHEFDVVTIEPNGTDFSVYGHDVYPENSVLEGQCRRVFLASGSKEELVEAFPMGDVIDHCSKTWHPSDATLEEISELPRTPPRWFDSLNAGERW